jgi:asparagine synthase (glutamine-hydrolysing)
MRRALVHIVPGELLDRKRKAFASRRPLVAISKNWDLLLKLTEDMVTASAGIVDSKELLRALYDARSGRAVPFLAITRTLCLELWLRSLVGFDKKLVVLPNREQSHSGRNSPLGFQLADRTWNLPGKEVRTDEI